MKALTSLLISIAFILTSCNSEVSVNRSSAPANPAPIARNLPIEAREIAKERPDVSYSVLESDSEAVNQALPAIRFELERKGFSSEDAEDAAFAAWRYLRVRQLGRSDNMTPEMLTNYVSYIGKLVIKSSPSNADVQLNGEELTKKTDTAAWLVPGTYVVRVSKPGYVAEVKSCSIKEDQKTELSFVLH